MTIGGRPNIGTVAERTRRTSMNDVVMFSEMTGDRNPLHYDEQLAAASPFGGLIVQGGVTSGLAECHRGGRSARAWLGPPGRRMAFREGDQGRRNDHRPRRGHQRTRRQADLHDRNRHTQRERRGLSGRYRGYLHCAIASAWLDPSVDGALASGRPACRNPSRKRSTRLRSPQKKKFERAVATV